MTSNPLFFDRRQLSIGLGSLVMASLTGACGASSPPPAREIRSDPRLPRAQAVLAQFVSDGRLPGLCAGVQMPDGSHAFIQAGTLDFDNTTAVDQHTLFRIYSMTKLVTGAVIAQLMDEGRLGLDQPVAELLPEMAAMTVAIDPARGLDARPAQTPMTVRHLLTHTSGLTYAQSGRNAVQRAYNEAGINADGLNSPDASLPQLVDRLGRIPLMFEPGTAYEYGVSFDVLGFIIERLTGQRLGDVFQQRLFTPLGMTETLWRLQPGDEARLAAIYDYGPIGRFVRTPVPDASAEALSRPVGIETGGAGLLSTASDYLKFLSMLLADGAGPDGIILKPETARLMRSDLLPAGVEALSGGHGFGGWVARPGHPRAGEFGWSGNASTQAWIEPSKQLAAVLMMQALPYRRVNVLSALRPALDADLGISR